MRGHRLGLNEWQRRFLAAAVLLSPSVALSQHTFAANGAPVVVRSQQRLDPVLALDRQATEAFESKSLESFNKIKVILDTESAAAEALIKAGANASACDVAVEQLHIIVGFAINKLDSSGRYQPWMLDETLSLLTEYQSFIQQCAEDAGHLPVAVKLTSQHVKAL
jgi:hypothetical protein